MKMILMVYMSVPPRLKAALSCLDPAVRHLTSLSALLI